MSAIFNTLGSPTPIETMPRMMNSGSEYEVTEVGVNSPKPVKRDYLMSGDVGYITASIKDIMQTRVGDTVTNANRPGDQQN